MQSNWDMNCLESFLVHDVKFTSLVCGQTSHTCHSYFFFMCSNMCHSLMGTPRCVLRALNVKSFNTVLTRSQALCVYMYRKTKYFDSCFQDSSFNATIQTWLMRTDLHLQELYYWCKVFTEVYLKLNGDRCIAKVRDSSHGFWDPSLCLPTIVLYHTVLLTASHNPRQAFTLWTWQEDL